MICLPIIISKDQIHLLERFVSRFGNQEKHPEEHQQTERGEEDVRAESELGQHVGRDLADDEVHHVVAGDDDADGLAAVTRGEDLRGEEPGDGAPGAGEVGAEDLEIVGLTLMPSVREMEEVVKKLTQMKTPLTHPAALPPALVKSLS